MSGFPPTNAAAIQPSRTLSSSVAPMSRTCRPPAQRPCLSVSRCILSYLVFSGSGLQFVEGLRVLGFYYLTKWKRILALHAMHFHYNKDKEPNGEGSTSSPCLSEPDLGGPRVSGTLAVCPCRHTMIVYLPLSRRGL